MKTVFGEIKCEVCGESRTYQADFETEDEDEARKLHAESLKPEILDFYALHSSHEVEYTPTFKPNGQGEEPKLRAAAAWCNWLLVNGHFGRESKM